MGRHRLCNCHANCILRHEQMARKLCLQNRTKLVDFCPGRFAGIGNCITDGELAELESSNKESRGGAEV